MSDAAGAAAGDGPMPPATCPQCGLVESPRVPPPPGMGEGRLIGGVTICLGCGGLGFRTDDGLSVRRPTAVEDYLIRRDPDWPTLHWVSSTLARRAGGGR